MSYFVFCWLFIIDQTPPVSQTIHLPTKYDSNLGQTNARGYCEYFLQQNILISCETILQRN